VAKDEDVVNGNNRKFEAEAMKTRTPKNARLAIRTDG
jgi:hypothetical protein